MTRPLYRVVVAGAAAAATFAAPAAALATTGHHARPATHRSAKHAPTKHTPTGHARHATAKVHGLVVRRSGNQLTVLAHTMSVGGHAVHRRVVTVTLAAPAGHRAARSVSAGDVVTATGSAVGSSVTGATVQSSTPRPASAVFGTVTNVTGSLVTITAQDSADGASSGPDGPASASADGSEGDQGDGQSSGDQQGEALLADVSAANFSGAATSAADLSVGEYVVALGERSDGTFAAADLVAYTGAPAVVVGQVSAADQSSNSLTVTPNSGDSSDDSTSEDGVTDGSTPAGTAVDTSAALVIVDGNTGTSFPGVGDHTLVVGPDGSAGTATGTTPLAASIVYDFTTGDSQPVGDNSDGSDGSGD